MTKNRTRREAVGAPLSPPGKKRVGRRLPAPTGSRRPLILVVYPGFFADGRTYEATRQVLQIRPGATAIHGRNRRLQWKDRPSKDPTVFQIDCYLCKDPEFGEFAVPVIHARILKG